MNFNLKNFYDKTMRDLNKQSHRSNVLAAPVRTVKQNRKPINILDNKKKQFTKLGDPQFAASLRAQYSIYSDRAYNYYSVVAGITAYLRSHLNDATILESYNSSSKDRSGYGIVAGAKDATLPYMDYYKNIAREAATGGGAVKIKGNEVQVELSPSVFYMRCSINDDTRPVLLKKLTALFGEFTIPTKFALDKETGSKKIILGSDYSTGLKPLTFYQRLNFPTNAAPGFYQPEKLELDITQRSRKNDRSQKDVIDAITVETALIDAKMDDYRVSYNENVGPIRNYIVQFTFQVKGVVNFPLEYALWATNAEEMSEFVPKVFREHFDLIGAMHVGVKSSSTYKSKLFARTMHIGTVKKINARNVKEFGITVRPRVNKENFTILNAGMVFYLPTEDKSDFYIDVLRKSWNPESGKIKKNSELREIHNMPLTVDWINDAFAYTDDSGKPSYRRLIGSIALDDVTIARDINRTLDSYDGQTITRRLMTIGDAVCNANSLYDKTGAFINTSYSDMFNHIIRNYGDMEWRRVVDNSLSYSAANEGDIIKNARDARLVVEFVRLNEQIATNWIKTTQSAIRTKCELIYNYYRMGIYVKRSKELWKTYQDSRENNAPIAEAALPDKFALPNLPGITHVLPHQMPMLAQSCQKAPELVVLDVAAGGGKTFQILADILCLLSQGKIKRPLIICPGGLVKEWTTEVNRASQGKMNVIPINVETIIRLVEYMNFTKLSYLEYLQKAPPNTIFVCSGNFLKGVKDHFSGENLGNLLQFGESLISFFPNVQLLRQLNPDYIALDESHLAKNPIAQYTAAVQSLMPVAKYRRVASGTIIQNDPTDMPSQYGLLNPAIFGSKEQFMTNYGIEQAGKFQRLQSGAERLLSAARAPFAFRINKGRRDWSHFLPIIKNAIYTSYLTENQAKFYRSILNKKLDELRNNPKIKKLLDKADEEKVKKFEKMLDKQLNVIEQFVNAPDFNPGFAELDTTKPKDLISPKVHMVNAIIANHLNGHIDDQTKQKIPPDPNKIIIFGYNKVVSRHIWRHFNYQNIGIHYAVKDCEPRRDADSEAPLMSGSEALLRFRQDPKIKILVADETSLREGLNLQMASRVIRIQSLFAPGAQEQAMSRALRPDVNNLYNREYLYVDWLITNATFEIGKAARIIGKSIVKFKVDEADNPKWQEHIRNTPIPDLDLLSMNLDSLDQYQTINDDPVNKYYQSYHAINDWEEDQFTETKAHYTKIFAKKLGIAESKIVLRRDAKMVFDGSAILAGTRSIFVPLTAGATPIDGRGLNLKPLAILVKKEEDKKNEDEDDEDDEDDTDDIDDENENNTKEEDLITYNKGDLVQTEHGFGYIGAATPEGKAILKKGVRVIIPGFNLAVNGQPYPVTYPRSVVFKPTPPISDTTDPLYKTWARNVTQLEKDMKKAGKSGITFVKGYVQPTTTQDPLPVENITTLRPPPKVAQHPAADPKIIKPQIKIIEEDGTEDEDEDEDDYEGLKIIPKKPTKIIEHLKTPKVTPGKGPRFDMDVAVFNGIPALMAYTDEDGNDLESLNDHGTWQQVPKFIHGHVQTYNGALRFIKNIEDKFPGTPDSIIDEFKKVAAMMRNKNTNELKVTRSAVRYSDIRNFLKLTHKTTADNAVKFYPLVYNHELFVVVNVSNQPKQARALQRLTISGVAKLEGNPPLAVHFGKNVTTLKAYLKKLASKDIKMRNYNEAMIALDDPVTHRLSGFIAR
jgi:hypothetical protein